MLSHPGLLCGAEGICSPAAVGAHELLHCLCRGCGRLGTWARAEVPPRAAMSPGQHLGAAEESPALQGSPSPTLALLAPCCLFVDKRMRPSFSCQLPGSGSADIKSSTGVCPAGEKGPTERCTEPCAKALRGAQWALVPVPGAAGSFLPRPRAPGSSSILSPTAAWGSLSLAQLQEPLCCSS